MNCDKLEFKPAHEFWNEAKNKLGYSWMDVYVEEYGDSTEFVLNNEHANCRTVLKWTPVDFNRSQSRSYFAPSSRSAITVLMLLDTFGFLDK
jgi:hypothetical protein